MTPYTLLGAALLWAASLAGAGWWAYGHGISTQQGRQAVADQVQVQQVETAQQQAATRVVRVQVQQRAIAQEVQREIETRVVYSDCEHSAEQLQRINAALGAEWPEPAGGGQLPATHTPHQPDLRRDDEQADRAGHDLQHLPGGPGAGHGAAAQAAVDAPAHLVDAMPEVP